ncbi:MAG: hypothetical protein M1828_005892 [Chrysothrix sp. TS-e1954]|nr:MAG: hypothetical protein M1828_005892 [Chrysothrix sp. TS-e1954]
MSMEEGSGSPSSELTVKGRSPSPDWDDEKNSARHVPTEALQSLIQAELDIIDEDLHSISMHNNGKQSTDSIQEGLTDVQRSLESIKTRIKRLDARKGDQRPSDSWIEEQKYNLKNADEARRQERRLNDKIDLDLQTACVEIEQRELQEAARDRRAGRRPNKCRTALELRSLIRHKQWGYLTQEAQDQIYANKKEVAEIEKSRQLPTPSQETRAPRQPSRSDSPSKTPSRSSRSSHSRDSSQAQRSSEQASARYPRGSEAPGEVSSRRQRSTQPGQSEQSGKPEQPTGTFRSSGQSSMAQQPRRPESPDVSKMTRGQQKSRRPGDDP